MLSLTALTWLKGEQVVRCVERCPSTVLCLTPLLQAVQTELVCAATIGVAGAALEAHTREARR